MHTYEIFFRTEVTLKSLFLRMSSVEEAHLDDGSKTKLRCSGVSIMHIRFLDMPQEKNVFVLFCSGAAAFDESSGFLTQSLGSSLDHES